MDLRITNPLDCYAPSTIGTAIWLRPPVRPDAILSQVVIAASVASRSASATGLSGRMRLMRGKRIATPDLWRDEAWTESNAIYGRSEEHRVGEESVSKVRSRGR